MGAPQTPVWHYEGGAPSRRSFWFFFGAKPNKGLSSSSSTWIEVGKGTWVRVVKRNSEKDLAKGEAEEQSTTVSRRKQWGKASQDELAFLVTLLKFCKKYTLALVCICTGNAVSRNHPSCTLSWPKPILFVCSLFFFSHPLGCIFCGHKEMCDAPIGTTRLITGQDRIVQRVDKYTEAEEVLSHQETRQQTIGQQDGKYCLFVCFFV